MRHLALPVILVLLGVIMLSLPVDSQCSMCRATAESSISGAEDSVGKGLNSGILYLMAVPYLLLLSIAIAFFRKPLWKLWHDLGHRV